MRSWKCVFRQCGDYNFKIFSGKRNQGALTWWEEEREGEGEEGEGKGGEGEGRGKKEGEKGWGVSIWPPTSKCVATALYDNTYSARVQVLRQKVCIYSRQPDEKKHAMAATVQ